MILRRPNYIGLLVDCMWNCIF